MEAMSLIDGLPGADLIEKGLADHANGLRSPEACLVEMASPRLAAAGILNAPSAMTDTEHTLYNLLGQQNPDPYPLYNSLCRRLVSFEQALDHRLRQNTQEKFLDSCNQRNEASLAIWKAASVPKGRDARPGRPHPKTPKPPPTPNSQLPTPNS
jgi:hypothetical protein